MKLFTGQGHNIAVYEQSQWSVNECKWCLLMPTTAVCEGWACPPVVAGWLPEEWDQLQSKQGPWGRSLYSLLHNIILYFIILSNSAVSCKKVTTHPILWTNDLNTSQLLNKQALVSETSPCKRWSWGWLRQNFCVTVCPSWCQPAKSLTGSQYFFNH